MPARMLAALHCTYGGWAQVLDLQSFARGSAGAARTTPPAPAAPAADAAVPPGSLRLDVWYIGGGGRTSVVVPATARAGAFTRATVLLTVSGPCCAGAH